jgi:GntR family transcriptional regulator
MTVRRALEELAVSRYIKQRQGSGTYVLPRRLEQPVDRVLGFSDEAKVLGFKAGSVLLEAKQVMADEEVAEALQIKEGETVLKISRLRTADDEPLAIQISYLAPSLKDLSIEKLKAVGSLYQAVYEQYGISPAGAKQTVSARLPTARELELLAISEITPVLALERITFAENHVPFEYVQSAYRSDRYKMLLDLSA